MRNKRMPVTLNQAHWEAMEDVKSAAKLDSLADAIRFGLRAAKMILIWRKAGYNEIIVRNPSKKTERVLAL